MKNEEEEGATIKGKTADEIPSEHRRRGGVNPSQIHPVEFRLHRSTCAYDHQDENATHCMRRVLVVE
ncbi:hypothetical protein [Synoicihabitans lomoniglobus]|uniref:Uncharacterized protein n=1 Tax=Synoicihabitans lomoniglobus TaxID=2909285 RepID=A0AAF0CQ32_9BACT|nr:hypothetical protein [Opitutaceae bacterium LMO-M01]WED65959.1 hypothetical protein PXH66_03735 [Opitutaceae bacterium LMO-M01]